MIRNLILGILKPRNLKFLGASILALCFCMPGYSQDPPSLGDLARQAQKEKSNKPAAKTLTNDDLPSTSGVATSGFGEVSDSRVPGKPGTSATASPTEELARMELILNKIDSLDRATLAKTVLQGADSDFPGRGKWEQKMYAAKQLYVTQGRDLILKAKQLQASAQTLQGSKNPDDPRAKDLTNRLKEFIRDAVREDADFQAVILEGRDLASQAPTR